MTKDLFNLLTKGQKTLFILLLFSYLPIILLETLSIGSIPVFVLMILNPEQIFEYINNIHLKKLILDSTDQERALYGLILVASLFIVKAAVVLSVNYFEISLQKKMDVENSKKLFKQYINSNYLFHIYNNPSELTQNLYDVKRTTSVIFSFNTIIKELLIILSISSILIFTNFFIFSSLILILGIPICISIIFFKNLLVNMGGIARIFRAKRLKVITESFNNIKFIKIANTEKYLIDLFDKNNLRSIHQDAKASFIQKIPRILLETFAVIAILFFVYIVYKNTENFLDIIPILTLLVVSIVRYIPSISNIIIAFNNYKFHHKSIQNFLSYFNNDFFDQNIQIDKTNDNFSFSKNILINNLSFSYPNNNISILKNLNFEIKKNQKIGISGKSGSGKSTLINIILGLFEGNEGKILCDEVDILDNLKNWHNIIGYVPQRITLFDDTIKNNICFGIDEKNIDKNFLEKILKSSNLDTFIDKLPEKLNTKVGHEGSIISGGQLQRVGIARALYLKPKILILDEPTSSLDKKIEEEIIEALFKIENLTIIIISHNENVLRKCDKILNLQN